MLLLDDFPVYVSGAPGHFIASHHCLVRLHWRVGDYRVSTVANYRCARTEEQIELAPGAFGETYIFRVADAPGAPEGVVKGWGEIEGRRYTSKDSRVAEQGHYDAARMVIRWIRGEEPAPDDQD